MAMLSTTKAFKVHVELHEGPAKGHSNIDTTIKKILTLGYWWLTLNKYVVKMC
jgi:hypothetical protein